MWPLMHRMQATGVWSEIESLKQIVAEPRKAGDEFDAAIAQYYKAIQHQGGGLFMAVCRGKVSRILSGAALPIYLWSSPL